MVFSTYTQASSSLLTDIFLGRLRGGVKGLLNGVYIGQRRERGRARERGMCKTDEVELTFFERFL